MTAIYLLDPAQYSQARSLFEELDYHLAVPAILAGDAPGRVYVDDPIHPRAGLVLYQHRLYLAGSPDRIDFNLSINQLALETYRPRGGEVYFVVYPAAGWETAIETLVLKDCQPKSYPREYYCLESDLLDADLPVADGFGLHPVDRALTLRSDLNGMIDLLEELCSERDSVEHFLEKSFGMLLVHGRDLVSWCLSEYNSGERCEVGIATMEAYRGRGLATLIGRAFVRQAFENEIRRVGWHCWKDNIPSGATARKIGLRLERTYPAFVGHLEGIES